MKKAFLALSILGFITLTSCGAQENCRGDRGYSVKQNVEKQNITITAETSTANNKF